MYISLCFRLNICTCIRVFIYMCLYIIKVGVDLNVFINVYIIYKE